jgi:hypothetical protein
MDIEYPGFGKIVVKGKTYDHDVIMEDGQMRARDKSPSNPSRVVTGTRRSLSMSRSRGRSLSWSSDPAIPAVSPSYPSSKRKPRNVTSISS